MNYRFAAKCLIEIACSLRGFDSLELQSHCSMLMAIAGELTKLAPALTDYAGLTVSDLKPEPPKRNPNSMIPVPVGPNGKGPGGYAN